MQGARSKKHKRLDKKARERARVLIALWYEARVSERRHQYRAVNQKPVMVDRGRSNRIDPLGNAKRQRPQNWNKPESLTAAGTESRAPRKSGGLVRATEIDIDGDSDLPPQLIFANKAMLHVINVNPDAHRALEMDAAGYSIDDISGELECGDRLAREYVSIGLAVISSLMFLRRELGW